MKIKNLKSKIFGIILLVTMTNCSPSRESRVDKVFENYSGEVPGAAVLIIQNGKPIFTGAYGLAELDKKIPVAPNTNFRLASFTKQFTAMCIMMLEEKGKLKYSNTLKEIFPEFPEYGENITILNLLHHTSGLIDYEDLIPDTAVIQVLDRDCLRMMEEQDSAYFAPGTKFRYSNTGYAVLSQIVEKVSGISFAEFLKDNIFHPLGMNNSVAFENGISTVSDRAYGYKADADSFVFADQSITSAVLGDGGIYSSVEDLFKWDQALYTNKLVSFETLKLAFTPKLETYGFGWRIDNYKGHARVHHTGSTSGFRTVIQRYPDDQFTVIILTNRDGPLVAGLAEKLTDIYLIGE